MQLIEKIEEILGLLNEIKDEVRRRDKHLFERWKAGGFIVDYNMSMYPSVTEVGNQLGNEDDEDDEEETEED